MLRQHYIYKFICVYLCMEAAVSHMLLICIDTSSINVLTLFYHDLLLEYAAFSNKISMFLVDKILQTVNKGQTSLQNLRPTELRPKPIHSEERVNWEILWNRTLLIQFWNVSVNKILWIKILDQKDEWMAYIFVDILNWHDRNTSSVIYFLRREGLNISKHVARFVFYCAVVYFNRQRREQWPIRGYIRCKPVYGLHNVSSFSCWLSVIIWRYKSSGFLYCDRLIE